MYGNLRNILFALAAAAFAVAELTSCTSVLDEGFVIRPHHVGTSAPKEELPTRRPDADIRDVFIVYAMGYNNLSSALKDDVKDLEKGYLPMGERTDDAVLAFVHGTARYGDYNTPTAPVLVRLYRSEAGETVRDTIATWPEGTVSSDAGTVNEVLTYIKEMFPAARYGMLMSSHATGWAPEGYCYDPSRFGDDDKNGGVIWQARKRPRYDSYISEYPLTRSMGSHFAGRASASIEMECTEIAAAIPMHLEYLIFDACFMGAVEVAYELRDVSEHLIFSQSEILSGGMDYINMLDLLLGERQPRLEAVCKGYYDMYMQQSGVSQTATVSLIDCSQVGYVADECRGLLEKYASDVAALGAEAAKYHPSVKVQGFFQSENKYYHGIFYDLEDIFVKAGIPDDELSGLRKALEKCVVCHYATPELFDEAVLTHSGLSMYLPDPDRNYLNGFYRSLPWNMSVGLL